VSVVLRELDAVLRVAVSDNGPGIGSDDQRIIFEKFRQAGNTMTEKPQGTGLGLPISRQIVEHLGGRLWVESEPGKGATFVFELPVATRAKAGSETVGEADGV
jgi:signal transduction histidine kinase